MISFLNTYQPVRAVRLAALATLALAAAMALSSCDSKRIDELEEGLSTEADVRARFGEPENIWLADDMAKTPQPGVAAEVGARTLEYNRQPEGLVNYMITIGVDGKMSALRQVLTPETFAKVQPGLPMETVRKMLGKPMKITPFSRQQETHYDWRYQASPNKKMIFTVVFNPDLKVVRTGSIDEQDANPRR